MGIIPPITLSLKEFYHHHGMARSTPRKTKGYAPLRKSPVDKFIAAKTKSVKVKSITTKPKRRKVKKADGPFPWSKWTTKSKKAKRRIIRCVMRYDWMNDEFLATAHEQYRGKDFQAMISDMKKEMLKRQERNSVNCLLSENQ